MCLVLELISPNAQIFWHYISIKRDNDDSQTIYLGRYKIKIESTRGHLIWASQLITTALGGNVGSAWYSY